MGAVPNGNGNGKLHVVTVSLQVVVSVLMGLLAWVGADLRTEVRDGTKAVNGLDRRVAVIETKLSLYHGDGAKKP